MNPWCTIGGVATTVCQSNDLIMYDTMRNIVGYFFNA